MKLEILSMKVASCWSFLLSSAIINVSLPLAASAQTVLQQPAVSATGKIVKASDFGVVPNSFENASAALKKAIDYCKGKDNITLLLPGGRIDLWPEGAYQRELYISNATEDDTLSKVKNIAMLFDGYKDITVEGDNTLVTLHGKMVSFSILNSTNITVKNIRFDYERPTMSELTIDSIGRQSLQVSIHPDTKYYIDEKGRVNFFGEGWKTKSFHTVLFDPVKNIVKRISTPLFLSGKAFEAGPLRIAFQGDFSKAGFHAGDRLSIRDPYRDNAGAFISGSKNIQLENLAMQYMHGMGIVSQFSENLAFVKVSVAPDKTSGRIIAAFADCFHFSGCKGSILIDSCFFSGAHDDPVNVHGTHLKITAINDRKLSVRFMHPQTWGFEAFFAGDSIAFINPGSLLPLGNAVLKNARMVSRREMELEVDGELPQSIKTGDCIENISWTPELTIRNSYFERTTTRGLLLTSRRKVLIENNTFFRTGMAAILIADDATSWYESGAVQDVTIRNNHFVECGFSSGPDSYVIDIAPENHETVRGKYVHKNIRIENNFFKVFSTPLLHAKSVDGLVFNHNTIELSDFMKSHDSKPAIQLMADKNVFVRNNRFYTKGKPVIGIENMNRKHVSADLFVAETGVKKNP